MAAGNKKIFYTLSIFALLSLVGLAFFIYWRQANFTAIDLGRHIKNGEMIFKDSALLYKNYYSYTEPDFTFINHHWLAGIIFYLLHKIGGFGALTALNAVLGILAFISAFMAANISDDPKKEKKGLRTQAASLLDSDRFWLSAVLSIPIILLLSERIEIRPELFSYLFLMLEFFLLKKWHESENFSYFWPLALIQLVWVNTHIYFFLGLILVSVFLLDHIFFPPGRLPYYFKAGIAKFPRQIAKAFLDFLHKEKKLALCYLAILATAFLNPNFIKGALYPLRIMEKYGYEIVENASPFFLQNLMIDPNIQILKAVLALLLLSFGFAIWNRRLSFRNLALAAIFSLLSITAMRHVSIFGLVCLPVLADNFSGSTGKIAAISEKFGKLMKRELLGPLIFFSLILLAGSWIYQDARGQNFFIRKEFGSGLERGIEGSAQFFRENEIKGPVLNDYDNGSAMIYWLFPREKVFVDNRPEAYSVEFFTSIYKPMLNDPKIWEEKEKKYGFNAIYFSHLDATVWARNFLASRLQDKKWPLVYMDGYSVIFLKDNAANEDLIKRYGIDEKKFAGIAKHSIGEADNADQAASYINLALLAGHPDLSVELGEETLKKYPDNHKILLPTAYALSGSKRKADKNKALIYFGKAVETGARLPSIYNQMGLVTFELGSMVQARSMWQMALDMDKKNENALDYLKQLDSLKMGQ